MEASRPGGSNFVARFMACLSPDLRSPWPRGNPRCSYRKASHRAHVGQEEKDSLAYMRIGSRAEIGLPAPSAYARDFVLCKAMNTAAGCRYRPGLPQWRYDQHHWLCNRYRTLLNEYDP